MAEGRTRFGSLGFVVGVLVAIPATAFALSNLEPATVEFLGWQAEVPLWLVIGASVLAGVVIGAGLTLALGARRRRTKKKARKAREQQAHAEGAQAQAALTQEAGPGGPPGETSELPATPPTDRPR